MFWFICFKLYYVSKPSIWNYFSNQLKISTILWICFRESINFCIIKFSWINLVYNPSSYSFYLCQLVPHNIVPTIVLVIYLHWRKVFIWKLWCSSINIHIYVWSWLVWWIILTWSVFSSCTLWWFLLSGSGWVFIQPFLFLL